MSRVTELHRTNAFLNVLKGAIEFEIHATMLKHYLKLLTFTANTSLKNCKFSCFLVADVTRTPLDP